MTMEPDTSARITLLRFPLVVGIVFIHAYGSNVGLTGGQVGMSQLVGPALLVQEYFSQILARISVPLFFLMSGFLFFESFDGSLTKYKSKLKSRIRTLLIPYLFWNLLTLLIFAIAQTNPITSRYFSGIYAKIASYNGYDFLNALFGITGGPIAFQFWFIRDLMLLILLSPIIYWMIRHIPYLTLFLLLCIWVLRLSPFGTSSSQSPFFFFAGGLIGSTTPRLDGCDKYGKVLFFIFLLFSIIDLLTKKLYYNLYINSIDVIIGIIVSIWLAGLINRTMIRISNALKALSQASFFTFAAHGLLLITIIKLSYVIFKPSNSIDIIALYFGNIFITTLICVILYFKINNILPSFMRIICGGR